jgi:hypothetical protein
LPAYHYGKVFYARDERHKEEIMRAEFRASANAEIGRFKGRGGIIRLSGGRRCKEPLCRWHQTYKENQPGEYLPAAVDTFFASSARARSQKLNDRTATTSPTVVIWSVLASPRCKAEVPFLEADFSTSDRKRTSDHDPMLGLLICGLTRRHFEFAGRDHDHLRTVRAIAKNLARFRTPGRGAARRVWGDRRLSRGLLGPDALALGDSGRSNRSSTQNEMKEDR